MSVSAARLFLGGGVVISLFFFCMGCILKICVLRKKRRCTQKLQGRIASIEGFRTSNMPMVLIEFFWPERYLLAPTPMDRNADRNLDQPTKSL